MASVGRILGLSPRQSIETTEQAISQASSYARLSGPTFEISRKGQAPAYKTSIDC
jgi:hypothetical protein